MGSTGSLAGRELELGRITAAIERASGAYLVGRAGVGKSRIVETVADLLTAAGYEAVRVRATVSSGELPLGVFLTQLGATERFLTPMFAEIRDRILERAQGRPVLLAVDDIDRLDDTSAVLIHQMVSSGEAKLLATLRMGRIAPGEIADLWQRGELQRLEIGPLERSGADAMADSLVGSSLDADSHERLWAATRGNALFIREVLLSAQEGGQLVEGPQGSSLAELPLRSPRLIDAVKGRLAHLDAGLHNVLVHLAFAEPCGPAELATVADGAALAALEAAELITSTLDGHRLSLALAHPLYGEVLRAGTPLLQRRAVLAALARDLQATGARRRPDAVKLARLAVDGGVEVDVGLLVRAASLTYHNGDPTLCERIGRRAFEATGRFDAGWELANCLYQAGDLTGFREHLGSWRAAATTDAERLVTSMIEAQTEFWYAGDMERAVAVTDEALRTGDPAAEWHGGAHPDELVANIALFHVLAGDPTRGWTLSEPLLDRDADPVLIRAAIAAANALGHLGRVDDAVAALDRAIATFSLIGNEASSLSLRIVLSVRAMGNLWRGDAERTRADVADALSNAASEFQISAANMVGAGMHLLHGRPSLARSLVEKAHDWWGRSSGGSTERRWVLARMAAVYAAAGDLAAARDALAQFDADHSPGIVFDFEAVIARARLLLAEGYPEDARQVLRDALPTFARRDLAIAELFTAYELVRMDRAEEVSARLAELGARMQGELFRTIVDHSAAIVSRDVAALAAVCDRFAAMEMDLFASEAAAQAADEARRSGDQRTATRWLTRAAELRLLCDAGVSATQIVDAGPTTLTRREREIAMMAAQGLASKEIGERLFISRRTAENHLAKVYDKLGVRTRSELARVLDGGVAALAS